MARVVQFHGAEAVVTQLLKVCPAATLQDACDRAWGVHSDDEDEHSARVGIGEASLHTPPTAPRHGMLDGHSVSSSPPPRKANIHKRCWHCEPFVGKRAARCDAVALLESLEADLQEVTIRIAQEEMKGGASSAARKSARYFLYRKWVGEQWGVLGRGVRIRIPPCVIEAIRNRFREPGCDCLLGGPLYCCVVHGYIGHRDAADVESEE